MATTQEIPKGSLIGRATRRVDGPLKVTGRALDASDFHFPGCFTGCQSKRPLRTAEKALDTDAAGKCPVRAIFHRENIGKIFRSVQGAGFEGISDERRPPSSKTTLFAITVSSSRWLSRTRSRPQKPRPTLFA